MPNFKILKASAERRHEMRSTAERLYRQHRDQVPRLIRQLGGPTQSEHDQAFDLLSQMSEMVASELLDALADPTLDDIAADEVVSLLGVTGDERAREPLWNFFQAHRDDLERASTGALSLSGLGDDRILPFLRQTLDADDEDVGATVTTADEGDLFPVGRPMGKAIMGNVVGDPPRLSPFDRHHPDIATPIEGNPLPVWAWIGVASTERRDRVCVGGQERQEQNDQ